MQTAFTCIVYPCLVLGYMGQAAYLSKNLADVDHGFFHSIPGEILRRFLSKYYFILSHFPSFITILDFRLGSAGSENEFILIPWSLNALCRTCILACLHRRYFFSLNLSLLHDFLLMFADMTYKPSPFSMFYTLADINRSDVGVDRWEPRRRYCDVLHNQAVPVTRICPLGESGAHITYNPWTDLHSRNQLDHVCHKLEYHSRVPKPS